MSSRKVGAATGKSVPLHQMRSVGSRTVLKAFGVAGRCTRFVQRMGALVNNNFPPSLQEMSVDGAPVVDLGAVDIARARERGVPPYNRVSPTNGPQGARFVPGSRLRRGDGGQVGATLRQGQEGMERLDLLVGTLAESVRPQYFGFGETLFQVFIQAASRRLEEIDSSPTGTTPRLTPRVGWRSSTKHG